jgi:hypothetical protein
MNPDTPIPPDSSGSLDLHCCLLTLALPLALEQEMLDFLREQHKLVPSFSVVHGYGIGSDAPLTTMMERVEGRARRVFVYMAMRRADVASLKVQLHAVFKSPEVFYWTVPLQEFGRLA